MKIGSSYKQHGIDGTFDAIVIGSGIGGLASAALLARHGGKRVLVLERHYTAGGFTHAFHRPGYDWDVGVHYIGQTQPKALLRRVFDHLTDGALEWADMGEVYDTIIIGDDVYELPAGRRNFRRRMIEYFPGEVAAIDDYLARIRAATRSSHLYYAEKVLPAPLATLLGPALRFRAMRHARRTTAEVMAEVTDNKRLAAVLTGQYGDYGLPPSQSSFLMHALVVNHYLGGGAYPVGGSARIAETMLPLIEESGGQVLVNAEVDEIIVERGRAVGVRLADGACARAPMVISDAGVANTYRRLLPAEVARRRGLDRRVGRIEPSLAHASLYLGLDRTAADLDLRTSNLWIYPHDDHDRALAEFMADPEAPLPVAYVSFPSAKDPDFERRHPGHGTIEVITPAPYDLFRCWEATRWKKRGADYEAFKQRLADRMLEALYSRVPQVRGAIAHQELSTPLSTRHFIAHPRGEIYGLTHTPARFEQRWLRPRTPIRGLYLTGADVCSAGVGGALFGGVLTASAALRKNLVTAIARGPARTQEPRPAPAPA